MSNPQIGRQTNSVAPITVRTETNPTTTTTTTTKLKGDTAKTISKGLADATHSLGKAANPQEGGNSATADSVIKAFDKLNELKLENILTDNGSNKLDGLLTNLNKELEGFKLDNKINQSAFEEEFSKQKMNTETGIDQLKNKINTIKEKLDWSNGLKSQKNLSRKF